MLLIAEDSMMNTRRSVSSPKDWIKLIGVVLFALLLCRTTVLGQSGGRMGGRHGSDGKDQSDSGSKSDYKPLPPPALLMPHAGDYVSTETNYYEIVYMPLQTRIYLYDSKFKPLSARDVHAQMTLQLPQETATRHIPFQYVPLPGGATEQNYVAAPFDIRPLQGEEASITFEFSGLQNRSSPTATFTPHYSPFNIRPYITQASLTEADRDAIARQRICPVTGVPLGSRGQVVKLYVAEFPLYVSGEDCIAAVKAAPQRFVPQAPPMPDLGP